MLGQEITFSKLNELELNTTIKELADFKFALDESSIVATTDHKGKITYVNDKFCEISKYSRNELIGKDHRIINSGYHPKVFFQEMWNTIQKWKCLVRGIEKSCKRWNVLLGENHDCSFC